MVIVTNPEPATVDIAAGIQLYDLNRQPLVKVSIAQRDIPSPCVSGAMRVVVVTTGGKSQLLMARVADCTDVRPVADVRHTVALLIDGAAKYTEDV